jgi:hypothetical protein
MVEIRSLKVKTFATVSLGLEKVRQIRWENCGTELEVYYTFSVVQEVKVINWREDS